MPENNPKNNPLSPLSVIDREFLELLNSPKDKNGKSTLSSVIYALGAVIFSVGVIESLAAPQLLGPRPVSHWQLTGIGLLASLITGLILIGFGKLVAWIIEKDAP